MFLTPVIRRHHAYSHQPAARLMRTAWMQPSAVDRWLDSVLSQTDTATRSGQSVRFAQDDSGYTLSIDVPGLSREHLQVAIDGAVVRLSTPEQAPRSLRAAWELPTEIDVDASTAQVADGVLTLLLKRLQPVNRERSLEVK